MSPSRRFDVLATRSLEVVGDRATLAHFAAEYGSGASTKPPAVRVAFESLGAAVDSADISGRHKTVSWSVNVKVTDDGLWTVIDLRGRPRWFARSLVQGYIVEPLLSLAAARQGEVLLPAAAIVQDSAALLLIGRSRSGKSSLSLHALSSGAVVLGDDQVLVDPAARVSRFPRRMRVYDDLMVTSPAAFAELPPRGRAQLQARRFARVASAGRIAPSYTIPHGTFRGSGAAPLSVPLGRTVLIQRSDAAARLVRGPLEIDKLVEEAASILAEQRTRIGSTSRRDVNALVSARAATERQILLGALGHAPAELITVPSSWSAPVAIRALASELGI